ncbi:TetR/AcrR family transcriptional regulator [Pyruvatibacter mobilis]|uniref:TetR/AcrR family transcriptional regulator n=1 Tax=Pyruvatibacter mobilis TaxID=1712261 RepID=UPI003C7D62E5
MATQEERRAATRSAVIEAATALFGTNGFDDTKMDDIVAKAGVAKGGIYHHFKNKHEIFEAVFEAVAAEIAAEMRQEIAPGQPPLDVLKQSATGFFRLCAEPLRRRIFLQDGPAVLGHEAWHRIDAHHFGGLVTSALGEAMEAGAIRPQPLKSLSRVMLGGIQAAALDCAAQDDFDAAAKDYLSVFAGILDGLK